MGDQINPFLTNKKNIKELEQLEEAISEIDAKYKAKIAEKKIAEIKNFPRKNFPRISEAMQSGAEETVQKLRQQVAEEINTSLENKAEREKESIHEQK